MGSVVGVCKCDKPVAFALFRAGIDYDKAASDRETFGEVGGEGFVRDRRGEAPNENLTARLDTFGGRLSGCNILVSAMYLRLLGFSISFR